MNAPANSLAADRLKDDPRVAEAKRLLREAVADHSQHLTDVCPPAGGLQADYDQWLKRLKACRGGAPWFPYLASGVGRGPYVELADGSVKLDFITGIGVHGMGHSHPQMIDATVDAALEDTVMQGNLQQHRGSVVMAERLIEMANGSGASIGHCLLSTSGAMANENALKLAMHARYPADRVIAFDNAFAGRSLALAALTDRPQYRTRLPLTMNVDYIPFYDHRDPQGSTQRSVAALKKLLARHPDRYSNLWLELVCGEGGYYAGSKEFFEALIGPAKEAGVPIIFDEVQTFSRLSRPFAFQHFELDAYADIVTIGKITQVCATLYRGALHPAAAILSQTFTGSTSSISCGLAVLDAFDAQGVFGSDGLNMRRHDYFAAGLQKLAVKHPGWISGPHGAGMMIGLTPRDGSAEVAKEMTMKLFRNGLMSFVAGSSPTRVRFLPPVACTTMEDIDRGLAIIDHTLTVWDRG
jgi:4-aminobutyrate aminotransferase-like enzyme